jgi:hypothetical protein
MGQLLLLRAWHQAPPSSFWRGVLAGLAIHMLVFLVALAFARLG